MSYDSLSSQAIGDFTCWRRIKTWTLLQVVETAERSKNGQRMLGKSRGLGTRAVSMGFGDLPDVDTETLRHQDIKTLSVWPDQCLAQPAGKVVPSQSLDWVKGSRTVGQSAEESSSKLAND